MVKEMLRESNAIEMEFSEEALEDALKAWDYAVSNEMSIDWVLEIHRLLLHRLSPSIAGQFRDGDVWVGGRHCKFFGKQKIEEDLRLILEDMTFKPSHPDPELLEDLVKTFHVHFEWLHPFFDGNGRTGRILYNVHRIKLGLPIHVIKAKEKHLYYKWFE